MLTLLTFTFNAIANFALGLGVAYYLGAQEFGTYALAAAAGTVLQTLFFEWLRLATNRFYGEKQVADDPGIVSTLNRGTGAIAALLSVAALVIYASGGALGATALVAAMAPLIAISGGLFDYRTALARACFQHKRYAALVIVKNVAALALMLGGALYWCRADVVLFGLCISALTGVAISARFFQEKPAERGKARAALLRQFMIYSAPLIVANMIFLANMFMARSGVALQHGMAESGRYSLALDIGLKLVATIGSGLDILLFQLAVRAEAERGIEAARDQLAKNLLVIVGIVLPACIGLWLALPSFEAIFVGPSYRVAFSTYLTLLLPGLFAYALIHYGVNPLFQIARRTTPVIASALVSLVATAAAMFLVPGTDGSHGAVATSVGFVAGLSVMIMLAWRIAPIDVPWLDLGKVLVAALGMTLAALPLHSQPGSALILVATAVVGGTVYGGLAMAMNIGGCRCTLLARLRRLRPAHS